MRYIKQSSSSSTVINTSTSSNGPKKGPISVGMTIDARPGGGKDVDVGMSTQAKSVGKGNTDFSIKSSVKSGKVDHLGIKVGVGDWAKEPNDGDDLDFLICLSGVKGGGKAPHLSEKKLKDIDLRFDINFKGLPLDAVFAPNTVDDLKLVKCKGADGKLGWGYVGTVDDARILKLALKSFKSGEKVADLAIKLDVDGSDDLHVA